MFSTSSSSLNVGWTDMASAEERGCMPISDSQDSLKDLLSGVDATIQLTDALLNGDLLCGGPCAFRLGEESEGGDAEEGLLAMSDSFGSFSSFDSDAFAFWRNGPGQDGQDNTKVDVSTLCTPSPHHVLVRTVSATSFATTATAVSSITSDTEEKEEFYNWIFKFKVVDEEELNLRTDATRALFQVTNFASFHSRRKNKTLRQLGLLPARAFLTFDEDAVVEVAAEGQVIEPPAAAKRSTWTRFVNRLR